MTDDIDDSFSAIARMIQEAEKHGLLVEVVWSFANEIRMGEVDYAVAGNEALSEWDI